MTGFDFKAQFIAALPSTPPELDLDFAEFIDFNPCDLACMPAQEAGFLLKHGLPRDAPPFLSFEAYSAPEIVRRLTIFGIAEHYYPLGHTGSGDVLALDQETCEIVYFNHDADNTRVFINSTLMQFARCLCIFQEHLRDATMEHCLANIRQLDPAAAAPGTMWADEVNAELG